MRARMIAAILYDLACAVMDGSFWQEDPSHSSPWDDAPATDSPAFWE